VDETTQRVAANQTQKPQYQQDDKYCPKHLYLPPSNSTYIYNTSLDASLNPVGCSISQQLPTINRGECQHPWSPRNKLFIQLRVLGHVQL
jgi:hypothetical protein